MATDPRQLDELLTRLTEGRLDELTPDQVQALERYLNESVPAAERLWTCKPPPLPGLRRGAPAPGPQDWEHLWQHIEAAAPPPRVRVTQGRAGMTRRLTFSLWLGGAAVAACVALGVLWRLAATPSPARAMLARHVVIDNLETFGDSTPVVVSTDPGEGISVIWVVDNDGV